MTTYAILLPGDEAVWEATPPEERPAVYERHRRFAERLAEGGHRIVGGAELAHSREALVVRGSGDGVTVTEGPYAETVEQLTGFYLVESEDVADLADACGLLTGGDGVEIRRCVEGS